MGLLYWFTCKNEECQYHVELREGVGWFGLIELSKFEEDVRSGKVDNIVAKNELENGAIIKTNAVYLCSKCKEFQTNNIKYLSKPIEESLNEFYNEISFPFGNPICEKCSNELIHIDHPEWSDEIKCPKCGGVIKVELGFFD